MSGTRSGTQDTPPNLSGYLPHPPPLIHNEVSTDEEIPLVMASLISTISPISITHNTATGKKDQRELMSLHPWLASIKATKKEGNLTKHVGQKQNL